MVGRQWRAEAVYSCLTWKMLGWSACNLYVQYAALPADWHIVLIIICGGFVIVLGRFHTRPHSPQ